MISFTFSPKVCLGFLLCHKFFGMFCYFVLHIRVVKFIYNELDRGRSKMAHNLGHCRSLGI